MDEQREELKALRRDLDQLVQSVADLARRIAIVETRRETASPPPIPNTPGIKTPPPPPLPPVPATGSPSPVDMAATPRAVQRRPRELKDELIFTGPSPREQFMAWCRACWRRLGPEEDMNWEMALATWWLPRIGLVVLSMGVVFLMTLTFNHFPEEYRPHVRLGLGFLAALVLMVSGLEFERREHGFGRLLSTGGLTLAYFASFASHYISYTQVFHSPSFSLLLMGFFVLIWAFAAQRRHAHLMALAMVILANGTIALSSVTLDEPHPFGIIGLVALSLVTVYFLVRNHWYAVALLGLVGTHLNTAIWLARSPGSDSAGAFVLAMGTLAVLFLTYALGEFAATGPRLRGLVPLRLRTVYTGFNTAAFLWLGVRLMRGFTFTDERTHVLYFLLAAFLLVLSVSYYRFRDRDALYPVYLTKASAVCALGLAALFDGHTLTLSLALETLVLLYTSRRTGHVTSRILALGAFLLTIAHGLYTDAGEGRLPYGAAGYLAAAVSLTVTTALLLAVSELYRRTDWRTRLASWTPRSGAFKTLGRHLELVRGEAEASEPVGRIVFPLLYSLGATGLLMLGLTRLLAPVHLSTGLGIAGLAVVALAMVLGNPGYIYAAMLLSGGGFLAHFNLWHSSVPNSPFWTISTWVPLLLLVEAGRNRLGGAGLWPRMKGRFHGWSPLPYVYATGLAVLLLSTIQLETGTDRHLFWFGVMAAACGGYAWLTGSRPMALPVAAAFLLSMAAGSAMFLDQQSNMYGLGGIFLLTVTALFSEHRIPDGRRGLALLRLRFAPYFLYAVPVLVGGLQVVTYFTGDTDVFVLLALAAGLAALMLVLHARAMALGSTAILLWALLLWNGRDWLDMMWNGRACFSLTDPYHAAALLPVIAAFGLDRFLAWRKVPMRGIPGGAVLLTAWVTALHWVHATGREWAVVPGIIISAVFLAHGAGFRVRAAAGAGLLSAVAITLLHVRSAYASPGEVTPQSAGFAALILFWIAVERLGQYGRYRKWPLLQGILVGLVTCLLVVALERVPSLSAFYLTIAWTTASVGFFAVAAGVRERTYRYAALAVLGLAMGRVFLIDTRVLEPMARTMAFIFLGFVSLAIAGAYVFARKRMGTGGKAD